MNTRLTLSPAATHTPRFTRATFSPIRIARASTSTAPNFRAPVLDIPAFQPTEAPRPAWHRGPLDRLQPILTRYRD